ncbi:16128_t:CDS:2, partial [Dentiscutata heterogama]
MSSDDKNENVSEIKISNQSDNKKETDEIPIYTKEFFEETSKIQLESFKMLDPLSRETILDITRKWQENIRKNLETVIPLDGSSERSLKRKYWDAFKKRSLDVVINSKTKKIHQEQEMIEKDKQKDDKIAKLENAVKLLLESNPSVSPEVLKLFKTLWIIHIDQENIIKNIGVLDNIIERNIISHLHDGVDVDNDIIQNTLKKWIEKYFDNGKYSK